MNLTICGKPVENLIRAADPGAPEELIQDMALAIFCVTMAGDEPSGWVYSHAMDAVDGIRRRSRGKMTGQLRRALVARGLRMGPANYMCFLHKNISEVLYNANRVFIAETSRPDSCSLNS